MKHPPPSKSDGVVANSRETCRAWQPTAFAGLAELGRCARAGHTSFEAIAAAYLERIREFDPKFGSFVHVASREALDAARALDALLASGTDLGPLMGLPVAIKDNYTVDGMPTAVGSKLDVRDLVEPEGTFVRLLKRAGCVVLGKTKMTEFASGTVNLANRPPWNPRDMRKHRMPGGSSSGSAVALAADLCTFSIGSDTGGSVRQPAALCGLVGYKPTMGAWPTDGVFPLSYTFDTVGWLAKSAADAALVHTTLSGTAPVRAASLRGLKLGKPLAYFYENLQPEVARCVEEALQRLEVAGAEIVALELPEVARTEAVFGSIVPAELLAHLGVERVHANLERMDALPRARVTDALGLHANEYVALTRAQQTAARSARDRLAGLDGWVSPTVPILPAAVDDCLTLDTASAWNRTSIRNTRPVNYLGQCAVSLPLPEQETGLAVGLQIACAPGEDVKLLSIAVAIEAVLGRLRA